MNARAREARRYADAEKFIYELRLKYRQKIISFEQARTLKRQAVNGDLDGAVKGLAVLVAKGGADACGNTRRG